MTRTHVGIEQARKTLGDLVTAVQQGADIVITRNGKPVVRLAKFQEPDMTIKLHDDVDDQDLTITVTGDTIRQIFTVDGTVTDDSIVYAGDDAQERAEQIADDYRTEGWRG